MPDDWKVINAYIDYSVESRKNINSKNKDLKIRRQNEEHWEAGVSQWSMKEIYASSGAFRIIMH